MHKDTQQSMSKKLAIKTLLNKRSLNALCNEKLSTQDIEKIINDLTDHLEARKEKEKLATEQKKQRQEKINSVLSMLAEDNIDVSELLKEKHHEAKRKNRTRPPKYQFMSDEGELKTWTGQGRTPKEIQRARMENGTPLEHFLIK